MTGEAGLVELDEVDSGRRERPELGVDDRDQGVGDRRAIGVDGAAVDAAGEGEWAGHGHLDRRIGVFPEPAILGDGAESVGCRQRLDRAIAVALIVRGAPQRRDVAESARARGDIRRSPG